MQTHTESTERASAELPRTLGLIDALSIVIGVIIGGGIFIVPNLVAQNVHTQRAIFGVWIFAGVVSFIGALACAELGAAMPSTGGQYVFLREAFGPFAGFLCGWISFLIARSAQVSWLAVVFTLYLSYFVHIGPIASKLIGLAAIAFFTTVNYRGVSFAAILQNLTTLAKVIGILIIAAGAFFFGHHAPPASFGVAPLTLSSFGVALIACLLSFDGWVQMSFVAGEIRNPQRNIFWGLALGVAIVMAVYVLANAAYMHVLSIDEIAASNRVGAAAAERIFGHFGGTLVSLIVLFSIIGTMNGCFLTSPRIYFAQAVDGLFFRRFAQVHPKYHTPWFAILAQGIWAAVLLLSGTYETLVDYAMFAIWFLYGLTIAGVIVLRRKRPNLPRPYRMWGYPITPLLFIVVAIWFLGNTLVHQPGPAGAGLLLILSGLPVYYIWRRVRTTGV